MKHALLTLLLSIIPVFLLSGMEPASFYQHQVRQAYRDILGREPDPGGLEAYTRALQEENRDERWLRQVLSTSEEAQLVRRKRVQSRQALLRTTGLWMVLFLATVSVGSEFLRGLDRLSSTPPASPGFFPSFWTGLGVLLTLGFFWSLFLPITSTPILLFSGMAVLCSRPRLRIQGWSKTSFQHPKKISPFLVFALLGIPLVGIALAYSLSNRFNAYDTLLYHWSAVRWMKEYPAVPGLANLHIRLGTNSAWLLFAAMLDHGEFAGKMAWALPAFFPAVCGMHLLHTLVSEKHPRPRLFALFMLPSVVSACVNASPGLYFDDPAQLALLSTVVEFLKSYNLRFQAKPLPSLPPSRILAFVVPATIAFVIKPVGAPILFVAGIGLFWHAIGLVRRAPTASAGQLALPGLLLAGWMARNAVLSGWLLFPAAIGPLPVDWRVPRDPLDSSLEEVIQSARGQNAVIRAWGRIPGEGFVKALNAPTREWAPVWWSANKHKPELFWGLPLGIALVSLWVLVLIASRNRTGMEFLALALIGSQLLFWFLMAPDLRFAHLLFSLAPAWCGAALLARVPWCAKTWLQPVWVAMAVAVLAGPFGRVIPKARQAKMGTPWATDLEQLAVDNGQTPPLKVFAPRRGDQTGDAPLPATPYPRTRLLARIPGSIRAGFQTKHNLGRFGEEP